MSLSRKLQSILDSREGWPGGTVSLTLFPTVASWDPLILVYDNARGYEEDSNFADFVDEKVAAMKKDMDARTKDERQGICETAISKQLSDYKSCLEKHLNGTQIQVTATGDANPMMVSYCGCLQHTVDEDYLNTRAFAILTKTYKTEDDPNKTLCRSQW